MVIIGIVVLVVVALLALIIGLSVGLKSWRALQTVSNCYHRGRGCEACWEEAFPRCVCVFPLFRGLMTCVCVFKVLGCVWVCLSLLCCSSFWLLLNKQAFPSFVWAVGLFADHLTPVLTCYSTSCLSASTSVEELIIGGGYHYHLHHPRPDTIAGERSCCHHPLHHQLAPPPWTWTWTHWYHSSVWKNRLFIWPLGKRDKLNQKVLLGCFSAAKMSLNSTRGATTSISVWRQKREMTKQSVFC